MSFSPRFERYSVPKGIYPEVARLLENCIVVPTAFAVLAKMNRVRQAEVAEHMVAAGDFSIAFAKSLLALTPPDLLSKEAVAQRIATRLAARFPVRIRSLQHEAAALARNLARFKKAYGRDVLTLTVYCRFIERLLATEHLVLYLSHTHPVALRTLRLAMIAANAKRTKTRRRVVTIGEPRLRLGPGSPSRGLER